jgi:hypothetical protein
VGGSIALLEEWERTTYSSCENVLRSLRSAPAQKDVSTAEARIKALVGPFWSSPAMPPKRLFHDGVGTSSPVAASYCAWMASISSRREDSNAREIALRAAGRLSSRMRMWPELGAGRSVTRTKSPPIASVEYRACRRTASRPMRRAADALSVRVNLGGMLSGCPARVRFNWRQNEGLREAGSRSFLAAAG